MSIQVTDDSYVIDRASVDSLTVFTNKLDELIVFDSTGKESDMYATSANTVEELEAEVTHLIAIIAAKKKAERDKTAFMLTAVQADEFVQYGIATRTFTGGSFDRVEWYPSLSDAEHRLDRYVGERGQHRDLDDGYGPNAKLVSRTVGQTRMLEVNRAD